MENRLFIKQKRREQASKSGQFTMFIVNHLTNANVSFLDFITKHVKFKREKVEETKFCKNFERKTNVLSNKNDVSGQVKVDSLRC